ncbi:MAG TPA: glycoside hydrolase family 99-like domain-containing protein, partial [Edaphobacter sp.]|nr:glycoside hydrolase family 99-like domain-containing protein [Edaphobacter sp.]
KNVDTVFDFYSKLLSEGSHSIVAPPPVEPPSESALPVKLIAFYLPQFHPIKENDQWWGEGFTEWSNVAGAKPVFSGHHQPQLPANLGFYDLRVPEIMQKQAELAAKHGIYGFCLYYYWFNGRKLLDLPLNQMLASGKPNFPFCLCWANENWTRAWDGAEKEVLVEQVHSDDADEDFIRELIPIFRDERYIRVAGAPLLLVYRVTALPDAAATAQRWRSICAKEGIPQIHLAAVQSFGFQDPRPYGFDSAVEFPPHVTRHLVPNEIVPGLAPTFEGYLEDYAQLARHQVQQPSVDYVRYRGVMPAWDNSARRGNKAHILIRSSPDLYEKWLRAIVDLTLSESEQPPLVFVNAWNEWAEGTHLEPDQKYGMAHLNATRRGLSTGIASFFDRLKVPISEAVVESVIDSVYADRLLTRIEDKSRVVRKMKKTESWFDDRSLEQIYKRYGKSFQVAPLSYATVTDYCDSFDHLNPLTTSNGDLKDVQRPWVLKAILGRVPKGGRLLEIGAGEPFVADLLSRLGYEVWVVDPYDGSGNGPLEYERFSAECPDVRFIRAQFGDRLLQLPEQSLDCVYSISVLEHIPPDGLLSVAAGMSKFLKKNGVSIHAVDHVHRGTGAADHLGNLELMVDLFGLSSKDLAHQLELVNQDADTYFLSAESHNRWRGSVPYSQFPMRVCISVQLSSEAAAIRTNLKQSSPNEEIAARNPAVPAPALQISSLTKSENLTPGDFGWAAGLSEREWIEFLAGVKPVDGHRPPKLPPADVQRMFVGSDGVTALQETAAFFQRVKRVASANGRPLQHDSKVLDFGVGWGRLYRLLLRDFAVTNLIGVDVDSKAIEMCKEAIPYGSFQQIPSLPPYPLGAGEFDLILLYSVFSHLSEHSLKTILSEFERILKPGGFVAFTTLKKAHLEVWAQRADQPHWREHLARAAFDAGFWRKKATTGDFLFVPTGGGDESRPSDFYGEAIVTEAFLGKALSKSSLYVAHFSEPGDAPQALVVLRRK